VSCTVIADGGLWVKPTVKPVEAAPSPTVTEVDDGTIASTSSSVITIATSAEVIAGAATVMVAVFAIFATLSVLEMKQLGVGLATAVLLDATLVRGVLLPAVLALLGRRAHTGPRWVPSLHG
jgi:RND superfamily putative drug exporter